MAGFGPIVREISESRGLYRESLGINFKEESGGIFIRKPLKARRPSPCGRLRKWRNPVLEEMPGQTRSRCHKLGLSLTSTVSNVQLRNSKRGAIEC